MINAGVVKCESMSQFTAVCAAMVREGCIFEADANLLIITLTGGH